MHFATFLFLLSTHTHTHPHMRAHTHTHISYLILCVCMHTCYSFTYWLQVPIDKNHVVVGILYKTYVFTSKTLLSFQHSFVFGQNLSFFFMYLSTLFLMCMCMCFSKLFFLSVYHHRFLYAYAYCISISICDAHMPCAYATPICIYTLAYALRICALHL